MFKTKGHRGPLVLAVLGLSLSSFSLLVLQATMNGLQGNVINRSKNVTGHYVLSLNNTDQAFALDVANKIENEFGIVTYIECELEALLKHNNYIVPVVVHGLDFKAPRPPFLANTISNDLLGSVDIIHYKLNADIDDKLQIISPSHMNSVLGDVPRTVSVKVSEWVQTMVPEVDSFHVWTRASLIQTLARKRYYNKIRIYDALDVKRLRHFIKQSFAAAVTIESWEDINQTLVYALRLENSILIFLFMSMTLLVSLCITAGLMLFFDKIKMDLSSFWILGASQDQLIKISAIMLSLIGFLSVILGILIGLLFLYLFDQHAGQIMPDVFVDRKIPIKVTANGLWMAFLFPFFVSLIFSFLSLLQFKKDENYLSLVKTVG